MFNLFFHKNKNKIKNKQKNKLKDDFFFLVQKTVLFYIKFLNYSTLVWLNQWKGRVLMRCLDEPQKLKCIS